MIAYHVKATMSGPAGTPIKNRQKKDAMQPLGLSLSWLSASFTMLNQNRSLIRKFKPLVVVAVGKSDNALGDVYARLDWAGLHKGLENSGLPVMYV